jgi:LuxR family transcriptional regulator, maltose regulon positive regulatory protein
VNRPLVDTKLNLPRGRPGGVARPRLAGRLDRGLESTLTLVSAPAGFGKTTVLAQWLAGLAERPAPDRPAVAWVSLDPHDDSPGVFWSYVIAALDGVAAGVGAAALPLLLGPGPAPEAALAALLNDLGAAGPVVLVLDDYHVIEAAEIHDAISYLLGHLPADAHLVLATRADPPLPLARLRARGELVELRSAELRFTRAEAGEYLAGPMHLALAPADVATLADRTEGWAAALQLAGLSLRDRADPAAAVAAFAGDDRFIVDYLAEEVLARQPAEVREFLLATSVLHRLTGGLCDAVTGRPGGAARLVELERGNLFLVPLDDRRQWYRYHHLFGDVLRAHLTERHPDRVAELHRRASHWLQSHGDLVEAIEHALAGDDLDRAADLMELALPILSRDRREAEVVGWAGVVPDELLRVRPVLAVGLAGALAQVSDFGTVDRRLTEVETAVRTGSGEWPAEPPAGLVVVDLDGYRRLPAMVQMYRAALALAHGDPAATIDHARRARTLAPDGNHLIRAGAGALAGLAAWSLGDLAAAHAAYTASAVDMREAGYLADILGLAITLGDLCRIQGRLGAGLRAYQDALDLVREVPGAALRGCADMHVGVAGVLLERGDLAGAAAELAAAELLGAANGLPQNPYRSRVVCARLHEAAGDLDAALAQLEAAERVYNGDYAPDVRPVPAVRATLRLRRGELAYAEAWAAGRGLAATDELSYLREYEHLTFARLLLARHRAGRAASALDDATGLLRRLAAAAERGGRQGILIELQVVLAVAQQAAGDTPAAVGSLREAVAVGEPEGYVRVFADEGAALAGLLAALVRAEPRSGYLRRLLAATTGPDQPAAAARGALPEPLSDRELDVLRLLATDLDGPDIARALHVSLNTMRTHSRNIFRKLQVTSRRAAVRRATELDLLPTRRRA